MQLFFLKLNLKLYSIYQMLQKMQLFLKIAETLKRKKTNNFFLKIESETAAEIRQYRFLLDR